ncbi:hypothetical protein GDI1664 [Gluconacetobacter diazotrophicus PA1 5]|uniref:Uncharacterized protein n=1 Tax=Gluconacetobacter diazotrophicus (strain ATCC 49037 / DSM 5601 / CCUG 37298 / CIP 103539 / LMG 7603 / PAl5) TaxID=272568 RepID=A9HH89_GLUDA|nr:hypothetical protein GDI1664 [Gluconacetobacter diazotrophicus PA1 5]
MYSSAFRSVVVDGTCVEDDQRGRNAHRGANSSGRTASCQPGTSTMPSMSPLIRAPFVRGRNAVRSEASFSRTRGIPAPKNADRGAEGPPRGIVFASAPDAAQAKRSTALAVAEALLCDVVEGTIWPVESNCVDDLDPSALAETRLTPTPAAYSGFTARWAA